MNKLLLLLRHAKSDWFSGVQDDHGRPLNARGRKDAPRIGQWIADNDFLPDKIFCSDAQRTWETLQLVFGSSGWQQHKPEMAYSHKLYMASKDDAIEIIDTHAMDGKRIMLIGHNPTMDQLVGHYCPEARLTQSGKLMTTAALAVIDLAQSENSRLLHLIRPDDL